MTDDRLEAIRQAAHAELARTPRARPWWVDAALLTGVNVVSGLGLALALSANDVQHASVALRELGAVGLLVLCVAGAVVAVRPGWRRARLGVLVATGALAGVLVGAASGLGAFGGMACGVMEAAASLVPVVASLVVLRRFAPDPLRTAVAALAAGAGGVFALHLHCPNGALSHLLVFHLLPWALVTLVAVALRRVLRSDTFAP